MKAIVQTRYGSPDLLELREVAKPTLKDDEVLVRVHAASVHPDVWHVVRGVPYVLRIMGSGVRRPKHEVPGTDLAGTVEAIGADVSRFEPGVAVFGETLRGYQWRNGGTFAEYAAAPAASVALKPDGLTFEQAAAIPTSALIALHGIRDQGKVEAGQRVLVNGAGGGVGMFAVQLAKAYGAHVTGVDGAGKLEMVRSLGADTTIDYAQTDFTRTGERHDVILDVPGNHSIADCRRALTPTGTYVLIGHDGFGATGGRWFGSLPRFLKLVAMTPFVEQMPELDFSSPDKTEGLAALSELIDAGKLSPVIDRTFPLGEVPAAIRHLETGRAHGKVIVTI